MNVILMCAKIVGKMILKMFRIAWNTMLAKLYLTESKRNIFVTIVARIKSVIIGYATSVITRFALYVQTKRKSNANINT